MKFSDWAAKCTRIAVFLWFVLNGGIAIAQPLDNFSKDDFISQLLDQHVQATNDIDKFNLSRALYLIYRFESIEKSIEFISLTLEHAKNLDDPTRLIYAHTELGAAYSELGDYRRAFEEYSNAFTIVSLSGISSEVYHTNYHLGKTYLDIQLPNLAQDLIQSAFENYGNDRSRWMPFYQQAYLNLEIGDTVTANQIIVQLSDLLNRLNDDDDIGNLHYSILLAGLYQKTGRIELAETLLNQIEAPLNKASLPFLHALASLTRANLLLASGNSVQALDFAHSAFELFQQHRHNSYLIKTLYLLSQIYGSIGNKELAYEYLNAFDQRQEAALRQQNLAVITTLQQQVNATTKIEEELQKSEELLRQRALYNMVFGILFIGLAVLSFLLYKNNIERQKTTLLLENYNREKNHFIGVVSHDLRSPLNSIMVLSEFMRDDPEMMDQETIKEYGSMIFGSTMQMKHLLNNMLDINMIESGKTSVETTPLDINQVLKQQIGLQSVVGKDKGIITEFTTEEALPKVLANENALSRVVDNLISNAYKFSETGKKVSISVREVGSQVEIAISDEGPGLTELDKTKLFKKFEKLSASPTGNEKSTGLGLYIVMNLVKQMDGNILVESETGKGTSFKVLLNKA